MYRFWVPAFPVLLSIAMLLSSKLTRAARHENKDRAVFEDLEDLPESPAADDEEGNQIENRMQLMGHERRRADETYLHPLLPTVPPRRNFVESVAYYARPRNTFNAFTNPVFPVWSFEARYPFFVRRSMPVNRRATTTTTTTYNSYPASANQTPGKGELQGRKRAALRKKASPGARSQRRRDGSRRTDEEEYPAEWGPCMEWVLNNLKICKVAAVLKSLKYNLEKRNVLMDEAFEEGVTAQKATSMSVIQLLAAVNEVLTHINEDLENSLSPQDSKKEETKADADEADEADAAVEEDVAELEAKAEDAADEEEAAKEDEETVEAKADAKESVEAKADAEESLEANADAEESPDDAEAAEEDDEDSVKTKKKEKSKSKEAEEDARRKANNKKRRPVRRWGKIRKKKPNNKAPSSRRNFSKGNVELQGSASDTSVFKEDFGNRIFVDDVEQQSEPVKSNSAPGSVVPNIRGDFSRRTSKSSRRNAKDTKAKKKEASEATSTMASAKLRKAAASKSQTAKAQKPAETKDEGSSPVVLENRMFLDNSTLTEKSTTAPNA